MASSSSGHYSGPPEPVALDAGATAVRDAYAFVRACEAARPEITVRRPWSRGNHSPRFVIEAHGTTRTCADVLAVRAALERDYPALPEAGTP